MAEPRAKRRLRCRFCSYSVLAFRLTKDGKRKSGYGSLRSHVVHEHPEEFEKIEAYVREVSR